MTRRHWIIGALPLALWAQGEGWLPLFDGKSMEGWKQSGFRNEGPVRVDGGALLLSAGKPMTGITYTKAFPKSGYELRYEAARLEGGDFFAALTFPVAESHCTLVTGGWGGDIVGLSSVDGWDASDNQTRTYYSFEAGRWYRFRVRVTAEKIQAWIDDEALIDLDIRGREIALRPGDTKLTAPLGFFSYGTTGGIRKIEYRPLPASK